MPSNVPLFLSWFKVVKRRDRIRKQYVFSVVLLPKLGSFCGTLATFTVYCKIHNDMLIESITRFIVQPVTIRSRYNELCRNMQFAIFRRCFAQFYANAWTNTARCVGRWKVLTKLQFHSLFNVCCYLTQSNTW